jgi:hypothetical protein
MRIIIAAILATLLGISSASAQTSPGFTNGPPPISAQRLNQAFMNKMDWPGSGLPFPLVNIDGSLGIGPRFVGSVVPDTFLEVNTSTRATPGILPNGTVLHLIGTGPR